MVEFISCDMDQFGDKSVEEIQRSESSLSNLAGTSDSLNENSADIFIEEPDPIRSWRLPPLKPDEVYADLKAFQMMALTTIKIREKSLTCAANCDSMMHLPLLTKDEIDKASKKYKYMHLGAVRVGINPLHRTGQNTWVFTALFDKRWTKFDLALLGGIQAPLNTGPVTYTAHPNFAVSLTDKNILDVLTLGVQTKGYEHFKSASENIAIFYSICLRFTNTMVPAVKNADKNTVTMLSYDESCRPTAPQQIPKLALKPPPAWVTSWNSAASHSISLAQSTIHEIDGQVITTFPTNQSSSAQRGGLPLSRSVSSASIHSSFPTSSTYPQYQIHPDMSSLMKNFDALQTEYQRLQRQLSTPQTAHLLAPEAHSPKAPEKDSEHPECLAACQKRSRKPFGHETSLDAYIGMHEPEYAPSYLREQLALIDERQSIPYGQNPGLGYYPTPLPANRLKPTSLNPSESEIRRFLFSYKNGSAPYDANNAQMKKMVNWDLMTHERSDEFLELAKQMPDPQKFKANAQKAWVDFMKTKNMWISFYEYYFNPPVLSKELELPQFNPNTVKLLSSPSSQVPVNMHQPEETESSDRRQRYTWTKPDGEVIETTYKIPPLEPLVDKDGNQEIKFTPLVYNNDKPEVSQGNWNNLTLHHAVEHFHSVSKRISDKIGVSIKENRIHFSALEDNLEEHKEALKSLAVNMDKQLDNIKTTTKEGQDEIRKDLVHIEGHVRQIKKSDQPSLGPVSSGVYSSFKPATKKEKPSSNSILERPSFFPATSVFAGRSPFIYTSGKNLWKREESESEEEAEINMHEEVNTDVAEAFHELNLSSEESEAEINLHQELDQIRLEEVNFQREKWKTKTPVKIPPEFYEKETDEKFNARELRRWSISFKTPSEIEKVLDNMVLQYNSYISATKSHDMSFSLIISSFDNMLQSWWSEMEIASPGWQATIKSAKLTYTNEQQAQAAGKHKGDQVLDSAGQPVPNAIGSLCWAISNHFLGKAENKATYCIPW